MPPVVDLESQPVRAFPQLKPRPNGPARREVEANQRARAHTAMIELVGTLGYTAARMDDIALLAGVSKRTLYDQFESKERFFLRTLGLVVMRATESVREAYAAETDWSLQIQRGFEVFTAYIAAEPKAARLALVESLGAGPKALRAMMVASSEFERLLGASFAVSPEKVHVPRLVVKGIAGGISRVARQRLIEDRADELPDLTDELLRWMLTYCTNAADGLPSNPTRHRPSVRPTRAWWHSGVTLRDERERMLATAVQIASEKDGYSGLAKLKLVHLLEHARVKRNTFAGTFPGGVEECFLLAYDRMGAEVAAYAAEVAATERDWPRAVHRAIVALMWRLADDPVFARFAFTEVFAVGNASLPHRTRLIQGFGDMLLHRAPADHRPSELVTEATVGAAWELVHGCVVTGSAHRLPEIADVATYLVLAPTIGPQAAVESIRASAASARD